MMKIQEVIVYRVIEVSPDETIGAAATARPAFAVGPCLNVQCSRRGAGTLNIKL